VQGAGKMQDMDFTSLALLGLILSFAGALILGEPAYDIYKYWQIKRAFRRRERADRARARRA
jgi:hypothetical protein